MTIFDVGGATKCVKKAGGVVISIALARALQSELSTKPYSASKGRLLTLTRASNSTS